MASAAANVEEFSGSIDYAVPFTRDSTYKQGEAVVSPTVLVGQCPMGLAVYPRGYLECAGHVSVFLEVRPRVDWWPHNWYLPGVGYQLRIRNSRVGLEDVTVRSDPLAPKTFSPDLLSRGRTKFLALDGYTALKENGWIFPDDTLRVHAEVFGESLTRPVGKLRETNQYAVMYKTMKFTDMQIVAGEGGEELQCHRAVLAACSPVFDRMLDTSMQEGAEQRLVLGHVCPSAVSALLQYIYVRNCPDAAMKDVHVLRDLLTLADQYELPDLMEQCARSMVGILDASNALTVLGFLRTHGEKPNVREHYREAMRRVQKDDSHSLLEALVAQASQRNSAEDSVGSQPSKRPRTEPAN